MDFEAKNNFIYPHNTQSQQQKVMSLQQKFHQKFAFFEEKPPQIVIRNIEEKHHLLHPINKAIRLVNNFAIEAFLKQNKSFFFPNRKDASAAKQNSYCAHPTGTSSHFGLSATGSASYMIQT